MDCAGIRFSSHAFVRMFEREIPPVAVAEVVRAGELIASYPDDEPYPSWLLLGSHEGQPVHAVVARDEATGVCYVVTVYRPDEALWERDFKTRRDS